MPAPKLAHLAPAPISETPQNPVALLAALHREAEETSRLANLLGRSIHVAVALPVFAAATLAFGGVGLGESIAWIVFVLTASGAIALSYRRTIGQPFERTALLSFSRDLSAIMLFAGFAWGAGAFLALPAGASIAVAALFAAGAGAAIALLLRERENAFLFLAPATALTSFACVLRPLDAGALGAAAVLMGAAIVAAAVVLAGRRSTDMHDLGELAGLPTA
jgi:hypothetical protein